MQKLEKSYIQENLGKTHCYKCGTSLDKAKIVELTDAPMTFVAHAICQKCAAESVVSISTMGIGAVPLLSDLSGVEVASFLKRKNVSYDELLDLNAALKKENIWNLLHKSEKSSVKKQKASEKIEKSQQ